MRDVFEQTSFAVIVSSTVRVCVLSVKFLAKLVSLSGIRLNVLIYRNILVLMLRAKQVRAVTEILDKNSGRIQEGTPKAKRDGGRTSRD